MGKVLMGIRDSRIPALDGHFRSLVSRMERLSSMNPSHFRLDEVDYDTVSTRRALFLATGAGLLAVGTWLMHDALNAGGMLPVEWILLVVFVPLFGLVSFGFAIAVWG